MLPGSSIQLTLDLTDAQWCLVEPLIDEFHVGSKGRGRPPASRRAVLNGILWKLANRNTPWHDLPQHYPPYQTCHRYFTHWVESGLLLAMLTTLFGETSKSLVTRMRLRKHHSLIRPTR